MTGEIAHTKHLPGWSAGLMLRLSSALSHAIIYMDPTYGEIIAGKIHLFCSKELIRKGRYTEDSQEFTKRIGQCFSNFSEQYRLMIAGLESPASHDRKPI